MSQERLPKLALLAKVNGRRPVGRTRTRWTNYIEDLDWNHLGLHSSKMMDVRKIMKCDGLISSCCPRNLHGKAGNGERRRFLVPIPPPPPTAKCWFRACQQLTSYFIIQPRLFYITNSVKKNPSLPLSMLKSEHSFAKVNWRDF